MPMLIVSIKAIHLTVPVMTVTMASNVLLSTSLLKVVITVMETVATMLDHTHALAMMDLMVTVKPVLISMPCRCFLYQHPRRLQLRMYRWLQR